MRLHQLFLCLIFSNCWRASGERIGRCFVSPFTMSHIEERNHENTVFVGELDSNVDEALLWELMVQVGPVGAFLIASLHLHFEAQ